MEKVVELEPEDAKVRFSFAVLLRDQCGDPEAADEQFRAYLRIDPGGEHAEEARASLLKPVQARSVDLAPENRELKSIP
jgi:hypothetical protein